MIPTLNRPQNVRMYILPHRATTKKMQEKISEKSTGTLKCNSKNIQERSRKGGIEKQKEHATNIK